MNRRQKRQISKELAAIASLKDSDIDTSDIPEITDWSQAVVGSFYRFGKTAPSLLATAGAGFKSQPLPEPNAQFAGDLLPKAQAQFTGTSLTEMTSQQLIVHCVEGQDAAWAEFVRRFQKLIAGIVVRAAREWGTSSRQVIEDLIQDTYVKLCANDFHVLRRFDPRHENAILVFLKIFASNVVYDHFRATGAMKRGGPEPLLSVDTAVSVDTVAQAERDVLLEEINRLLDTRASGRDRAMFWLHYHHGFTAKEIASNPGFNLTVRGVESVLHRLTQLLKRELIQAPAEFEAQQGAAALPLTDLNEHSFDQLLRHTRPSPKKKP